MQDFGACHSRDIRTFWLTGVLFIFPSYETVLSLGTVVNLCAR